MSWFRSRHGRRGANAVEFALTFPVFFLMITIPVDYGWFFLQQSLVQDALRDAVRIGSFQKPAANETGCATCISTTATRAVANLNTLGFTSVTSADVQATVTPMGGVCVLILQPTATSLQHRALVGWAPVPTRYGARVVSVAQFTPNCV